MLIYAMKRCLIPRERYSNDPWIDFSYSWPAYTGTRTPIGKQRFVLYVTQTGSGVNPAYPMGKGVFAGTAAEAWQCTLSSN
jgi:hypothetical protein